MRSRQSLTEAGIGSEIYYPLAMPSAGMLPGVRHTGCVLPETERAAREVLALPIYPELTLAEQTLVVDRIAAFFAGRRTSITAPHAAATL